jgi:crotonobetainyl-CoA:carnitine CoA-transferase CaiB-like acyl-CoA transferase
MYYAFDGAAPPPRSGATHASIYPYGPFATGDGGTVVLGLQNEREWQRFCEQVLQDPALADHPDYRTNALRSEHRAALGARIVSDFAGLATAEVLARLDRAQIANGRMNDMAGLWAHPQLAARGRWREVDSPAGRLPALLPPGRNASFEPRMDGVPAVGQHTEPILRELGLDDAAIAGLKSSNAI